MSSDSPDGSTFDGSDDGTAPSGPSFAITPPPTLTLQEGQSASVPITITRTGGFTGAISITLSGLPAGATANPLTITSDSTTGSLTIVAAASTPQSLSHLSIDGVSADGKTSASAKMDLIVSGTPGSLDTLFGTQGIASGFFAPGVYEVLGAALDAQQNIVVTGFAGNNPATASLAMLRVTPDGTADKTFGTNGTLVAAFSPLAGDGFIDVFPLKTGPIMIAGSIGSSNNVGVLARITANGTIDSTYSQDGGLGYAFPSSPGIMFDYAMDDAGSFIGVGVNTSTIPADAYASRRLPNGDLDTTFGTHNYNVGTQGSTALYPAIQSDGKIVFQISTTTSGMEGIGLLRVSATGVPDTTFGDGTGFVPVNALTQGSGTALAIAPDGKIMCSGIRQGSGVHFVARYNTDGSLDTTYGDINGTANVASAFDMAIQPDGKVVVVGDKNLDDGGETNLVLVIERLLTTGLPDPSFGNDGIVETPIGSTTAGTATAKKVLIQSDGRIVVVGGYGPSATTADIAIARYWP